MEKIPQDCRFLSLVGKGKDRVGLGQAVRSTAKHNKAEASTVLDMSNGSRKRPAHCNAARWGWRKTTHACRREPNHSNMEPRVGDRKNTTKKLCDKDFANRSGELPGAICLKALVFKNNHKGGTVAEGYGFGYVSDMYPSPF